MNNLANQWQNEGHASKCQWSATNRGCKRVDYPFEITSEGTHDMVSGNSLTVDGCDVDCDSESPPTSTGDSVTGTITVSYTESRQHQVTGKISGSSSITGIKAELNVGVGGSQQTTCTQSSSMTLSVVACKWKKATSMMSIRVGKSGKIRHEWIQTETVESSPGESCPYAGQAVEQVCDSAESTIVANICLGDASASIDGPNDCPVPDPGV